MKTSVILVAFALLIVIAMQNKKTDAKYSENESYQKQAALAFQQRFN